MTRFGEIDSNQDINMGNDPVWVNGVQKTSLTRYISSAVVSGGVATFYLTTTGDSSGEAVFTDVHTGTATMFVNDSTSSYTYGGMTVSEDKKSVTVNVSRLGSVLLGIIQIVTAANGTTVWLSIYGE